MKSPRLSKFWFLWLVMAAVALWLYYSRDVNADFMGIVETRTHKLSAQEPGRIKQILVALGEQVKPNQLLVTLDTSDLDTEEAWLKEEFERLEALTEADRSRYTLEYEKLRLQTSADASNLDRRKAELEAAKAEFNAVSAEVERLIQAQNAGLGRPKDLSDLIIRRDSLNFYINQQNSSLGKTIKTNTKSSILDGKNGGEQIVDSMLSQRIERINEIKLKLKIIETRRDRRKVITPCEGRVVKINFLPGDATDAFNTILTIEEPQAEFIDVYIPETSNSKPQLGERVSIYPHRSLEMATKGTIIFIDPGYSPIPERLAFRQIIYWARKFRVKLDEGHHLMPGEAAKVEMSGEITPIHSAQASEVAQSTEPAHKENSPQTRVKETLPQIKVPEQLHKISSFEPSGIAWLPDIERYLIVSDDTSKGKAEHAPWIFLMTKDGEVESSPVQLFGADTVNDLESISTVDANTFYIVSSQSISKKGKRPPSREQILKVQRTGRIFKVTGKVNFLSLLLSSYTKDQLKALGLGELDSNGNLILNIEGSAWLKGDLLLGLKQPRASKGAIIWRLKNPDLIFSAKTLSPDQLSVYGYADLRTPAGRLAAISDLAIDSNGALLALSTVPNAPKAEQMGGLHRLKLTDAGSFEVQTLFTFPELKPEGLCALDIGSYTIVFDADDEPTNYLTIELSKP